MTEIERLKQELQNVLRATRGEDITTSYWDGDAASKLQAEDNARSGRIHIATANKHASIAIEHIDSTPISAVDVEFVRVCLQSANDLVRSALLLQLKPSQVAHLFRDARKRGAPSTTGERDKLLAREVQALEAGGAMKQAEAIDKAIKGNPELKAAFAYVKPHGIRAALKRGVKALQLSGN